MVMVAMCKVREDPGELDLLGPHSIPAGGQLPPEFCLFPARSSHGLQRSHASNFGAGIMGRFRQSRLGENTIIYFLDRVLAHQDELSLQRLGIHCRTTNILRLQSLYSPNFFNDFFFLKIQELALQGHCQEPSQRLSKLLVNSEPSEFHEHFIFRVLLPGGCLEAGPCLLRQPCR